MKRKFGCLGDGSSSKVVQDPSEISPPPEPSDSSDSSGQTDSSESIEEEDLVNFGWHEFVDGIENFGNEIDFTKLYRCNFPRIHKVGTVRFCNLDESVAEITTIQAADHPNVIKLIGKYRGHQKSATVYEFMPNGSLDHHLFPPERQGQGLTQLTQVLVWETRMRIAVGVAEGLAYVHKELLSIHRDLKVTTILLDDKLVPKLTDFGIAAKIVYKEDGSERQRVINTMGAQGYIAPETEEFGLVSTKSDVYSYGVFLLVLFTGKKVNDPQKCLKLTDWVMQLWTSSKYEPVDVALGKKYSVEGLKRIYETARLCINLRPQARPAMSDVETMVREAADFRFQNVQRRLPF